MTCVEAGLTDGRCAVSLENRLQEPHGTCGLLLVEEDAATELIGSGSRLNVVAYVLREDSIESPHARQTWHMNGISSTLGCRQELA